MFVKHTFVSPSIYAQLHPHSALDASEAEPYDHVPTHSIVQDHAPIVLFLVALQDNDLDSRLTYETYQTVLQQDPVSS